MFRIIRIILATLSFTLISLLFLDFTGTLYAWFGGLAKIQLVPALLALNLGLVAVLIIVTLLLGRVYCSIICPLGVFQDIVSRVISKKNSFRYLKAITWLRVGTCMLFVGAFIAGFGFIAALIEPYSAYGRIASNLFAPLWQWGNNILADFAEKTGSYAFYTVDVWIKSTPTYIIAVATFIIIVILALRNGRTYCNTICPVGTVLGYISKYSLYKPHFDTDKCISCGLCEKNCKASCIDSKNKIIDYSRCVSCFNCTGKCTSDAMNYGRKSKKIASREKQKPKGTKDTDNTRRSFLTASFALGATGVPVQRDPVAMKVDGGLAPLLDRKRPNRTTLLVPPGAIGEKNFATKCIACQLCVAVCPHGVLRPSEKFDTFMQPELSYERGYCRPECVKCSEVCPTGAIQKITKEEKTAISIGQAVWIEKNCIVLAENKTCGNCEKHCPSEAIQMVAYDATRKIPAVNIERCIGCGTCEYLCPAAPLSAIYVEGNTRHRTI